ncbi:hypothetical protein PFICI_05949 [Pestalotiopsis fici W106-1]|uniref:Uncharacterized protein n=1 Tax=Pestalotiopsis fici (strain W106-1 / CGMCC3.15140) TaxID=1229662 RepID=W3XD97_PESFW|nr:uncharacterized protein PFICI_05949 [Pestalotiopsis fici W106-1]ETS84073.1 hypothetical protein PFICI_05949 [Pestalotiopsis fici W106-1]
MAPKRSPHLPRPPLPPIPVLEQQFHLRPPSSSPFPTHLPSLLFREPGPPWNSFRDFVLDSLHHQGCNPVNPADVSSITQQLTSILSKIGQHYRTYQVVPSWDTLSGLIAGQKTPSYFPSRNSSSLVEPCLFTAEFCREETPPNGEEETPPHGEGEPPPHEETDHDNPNNLTPLSEELGNDIDGLNNIYDLYNFDAVHNVSPVHISTLTEDGYDFCETKELDMSNLGPLHCNCEGVPLVHDCPLTAVFDAISPRLFTFMEDM